MSRTVPKKCSLSAECPALIVRMEGRQIGVSLVPGPASGERLVGNHQELLRAIAGLLDSGRRTIPLRPRAILVAGVAERFSDSRSIATIANTLAFAWDIPIAATRLSSTLLDEKTWPQFFSRTHAAVKAHYSGKPHITVPRKKPSQPSRAFRKTLSPRP